MSDTIATDKAVAHAESYVELRLNSDDALLAAEGRRLVRARVEPPWDRRPGGLARAFAVLGDAGWLHGILSTDVGGGELSRGVLSAMAIEAGRAVVVDEFVNNVVLLPLLLAAITDTSARARFLERHRQHPGFLLADGRVRLIRTLATESAKWVYGVHPDFDVYVVAPLTQTDRTRITRITNADIDLREIAGLAPAVGTVTVNGGAAAYSTVELSSERHDRIVALSTLVHSAGLVGLAREAIRRTIEYTQVRTQFGRPIGQFQAVKHLLADLHVETEVAGLAIAYAAQTGHAIEYETARVKAIDAAMAATTGMVQLFGGIGYTWEHPAHWFLKTAVSGCSRFGGERCSAEHIGQWLETSAIRDEPRQ